MKQTKIFVLFLTLSIIFTQNVFAKRLGGGGNYGMQRSSFHQSYNQRPQTTYAGGQGYNQQTTPGQRTGMGAGTAAAVGAVAGAAGGYMLGRSMSNNGSNQMGESGNQQQPGYASSMMGGSNIPWGIISILVVLLAFGMMFFRRNKMAAAPNQNFMNQNNQGFNSNLYSATNTAATSIFGQSNKANNPGQVMMGTDDKMPDGIETVYFLRQVKGMFLHVQSMNNAENITEIQKYMTPELYNEIKNTISTNSSIADFNNLDCQLLSCALENNQLIASVKFSGSVSEEANVPAIQFSETWNFIKANLTVNKWLIAGIQQEPINA